MRRGAGEPQDAWLVEPHGGAALGDAQVARAERRVEGVRGRVVLQHVPIDTRDAECGRRARQVFQQAAADARAPGVRRHVQILQVERSPRPARVSAVDDRAPHRDTPPLCHQRKEPWWRALESVRDQIWITKHVVSFSLRATPNPPLAPGLHPPRTFHGEARSFRHAFECCQLL